MNVSQRTTFAIAIPGTRAIGRSIPASGVRGRLMAVGAATVVLMVVSPFVSFSSVWLIAAMLSMAVARIVVPRNVLVAGVGPEAAVLAAMLEDEQARPVIYQAATAVDASMLMQSIPLGTVILDGTVDRVALERAAASSGMSPRFVSSASAVSALLGRVPQSMIDRSDLLHDVANRSRLYDTVKRGFDLAVALTMGLAVLPLLPLVALAIRLDSRGSILYSQERVGLNGRTFRIYKFRSMRSDAEKNGAQWAAISDSRVTRVGRILRLSRIDELPQLWNVLRGDMTLVGPRPERPEFTTLLEAQIPGYTLRTLVKPGLTGWAQVSYRYTSSVSETRTKLEYDMYYVKFSSLAMDVRILFRTISVVLNMRGC